MQNRTLAITLILLAAFAALLPAAPAAFAAPSTPSAKPDGWALLWSNQDVAARSAFKAELAAHPGDVDALRGLALLDRSEDKPKDEVSHLGMMIAAAPASWSTVAYWPEFGQQAEMAGQYGELAAASNAILASPAASNQIKTDAALALVDVYNEAGQRAKAAQLVDSVGFVGDWKCIGPFDNTSRSGFDKRFGPESEIDYDKTYDGDSNMTLRWLPQTAIDLDHFQGLADTLSQKEEQLSYAVTAVDSDTARDATLDIDCQGAVKVFVGGHCVLDNPVYRTRREIAVEDIEAPISLQAGWNVILVKLASDDEVGDARFRLRLTARDGAALHLPCDPAHAAGFTAPPTPDPAPAPKGSCFLLDTLAKAPATIETGRLTAIADYENSDYESSESVFHALIEKNPNAALLHYDLGATYDADDRRDDADAEYEKATKFDLRLIPAQSAYLSDTRDRMQPDAMIAKLKSFLAVSPDSPMIWSGLESEYTAAGLSAESDHAQMREFDQDNGPGSYSDLIDQDSGSQISAQTKTLLAKGYALYPNDDSVLYEHALYLTDQNQNDAAIAVYKRMLTWDAALVDDEQAMADLYKDSGHKQLALTTLLTLERQEPQDADVAGEIADLDQDLGHKTDAIRMYRLAIALDPSEMDLRDKLDLVSGAKPPLEIVPETPAAPILANLPKAADANGASTITSLDEARMAVYPDGATVEEEHEIITVFDDTAVKDYGEIPIDRETGTATAKTEIARVIKADGRIQDCMQYADDDSISFPSLAKGDTIEYEVRIEDYQKGALAGMFWTSWVFNTHLGPNKLTHFVLMTPIGKSYQSATHGGVPKPTVTQVGNWQISDWKETNVPSLAIERAMPAGGDVDTWLDISSVPDWGTVARWYEDLSSSRCIADDTVRQKTLDLTAGCATDQDKLAAIVAYVRQIPYQSSPFRLSAYIPTEGKKVIRDQYGDCKDKAALITAMLGVVGIKANMVLLSGRDMGTTPYLPSPRFDHAIAYVQTAGGPIFVDGTAEDMQVGGLPYDDEGVPCLIVTPTTTDLSQTELTPMDIEYWNVDTTASATADGKLSAAVDMTYSGNMAWLFRSIFKDTPENKRDIMLSTLSTAFYPDSTYDSGSIDGLTDVDKPFHMHLSYHNNSFCTQAGDYIVMSIPWIKDISLSRSELNADHRQTPLEVAESRLKATWTVNLKLPDGYSPVQLPADSRQDSKWLSYSYHYSVSGNMLTARLTEVSTALRIPADEVGPYFDFADKEKHDLTQQLLLKKN